MPPTLQVTQIRSLQEFTTVVERAFLAAGTLWYRGVDDTDADLKPSLYRPHPTATTIEQMLKIEQDMLERFKERAVPHLTRSISEDWEFLFLMQHFGVPTRLLDWTENPFMALYFALAHRRNLEVDAAVWVLNPTLWNKKVLEHVGSTGEVLSKGSTKLNGYATGLDIDSMNTHPVAMYGTHNSPRIVAQRGVFTMFGKSIDSMQTTYSTNDFPQPTLQKLSLPKENCIALMASLAHIGITDSVIFPDLEGLAREIKRSFGFHVR